MRATLRSSLSALVLAALIGACGSESASVLAPRPAESRTLDDVLSVIRPPFVPDALAPVYGVWMGIPTGIVSSHCVYGASTGSFVCPPETYEGFTTSARYSLLDASGRTQSAYDAATTATVRVVFDVDASYQGSETALVIDNHYELELTGLLSETQVLNGTSTEHVKGALRFIDGIPDPVDVTARATFANLVVRRSGTPLSTWWPTAGTVTFESSAALGAGLPPAKGLLTMTFSGTSTVSIVGTVAGVTRQCSFDLARGVVPTCA